MRTATVQRVGNDIVDLGDLSAAGKHRDKRFMERVFLPRERDRIARHDDPDRCLWSMWAAKETAYKVLAKASPSVPARPGLYEVFLPESLAACSKGRVASPWGIVPVTLQVLDDHIHCVGTSDGWQDRGRIRCGLRRLNGTAGPEAASQGARSLLVRDIAGGLGIAADRIRIVRPRGQRGLLYPRVRIDGDHCLIDISISHHGSYTGYARTVIQEECSSSALEAARIATISSPSSLS